MVVGCGRSPLELRGAPPCQYVSLFAGARYRAAPKISEAVMAASKSLETCSMKMPGELLLGKPNQRQAVVARQVVEESAAAVLER